MQTLLKILTTLLLLYNPANLLAEDNQSVGFIKSTSGVVTVVHGDDERQGVSLMTFAKGDIVRTGRDSSAGLVFQDDTVVSLGSQSEIVIVDYAFNPLESKLAFVTRLTKGVFSFITGQIGKLAPQKVELMTPNATLGVRGTKFIILVD